MAIRFTRAPKAWPRPLPWAAFTISAACMLAVGTRAFLSSTRHRDAPDRLATAEMRYTGMRTVAVGGRGTTTSVDPCVHVSTHAYMPSAWEAAWRQDSAGLGTVNATVCSAMQRHDNALKSAAWIAHLDVCRKAQAMTPDSAADCLGKADPAIFSRFHKSCITASGERVDWEEPIEPLVGHMRHPRANPACVPSGIAGVGIEDRDYLMPLSLVAPSLADHGYTGRRYLVDAGTSTYGTGLAWLVDTYARAGIVFDEIFAWEAAPLDAAAYWSGVPPAMAHKLHLMNVPISAEPGAAMNPLTWIRNIYMPGDFVVFKLDIDQDGPEGALIRQIADSPDLVDVIAEMFYEKHYSEPAMAGYTGFDEEAGSYVDAVALLSDVRAKGLRMHYWP